MPNWDSSLGHDQNRLETNAGRAPLRLSHAWLDEHPGLIIQIIFVPVPLPTSHSRTEVRACGEQSNHERLLWRLQPPAERGNHAGLKTTEKDLASADLIDEPAMAIQN